MEFRFYDVACKDCKHVEVIRYTHEVPKDGKVKGKKISSCVKCGSLNVTWQINDSFAAK